MVGMDTPADIVYSDYRMQLPEPTQSQGPVTLFERPSLRSALRDEIRGRLLRGEIASGERVVELTLAEELGVSRTPLREALIGLEREGFVEALPGRGFIVAALTIEDAHDTYALIGVLEAAALRDLAALSEDDVTRLGECNERLRNAASADAAIQADEGWHRTLLQGCRNTRLMKLRDREIQHARRYEHAFMADADRLVDSADAHDQILALIRAGEAAAAQRATTAHWERGVRVVESSLGTRRPLGRSAAPFDAQ